MPLDGDIPKGWKRSFEATVRLLGGGEWGEIEVKKDTVRVSDVEPGSEEKLRHHLEAVVQQANADHEPDESEEDEAPDAERVRARGRRRGRRSGRRDDPAVPVVLVAATSYASALPTASSSCAGWNGLTTKSFAPF